METVLLIIIQVLLLTAMCYTMHTVGFMAGVDFQKNIGKQIEKAKNEQIRQLKKYVERLEKGHRR